MILFSVSHNDAGAARKMRAAPAVGGCYSMSYGALLCSMFMEMLFNQDVTVTVNFFSFTVPVLSIAFTTTVYVAEEAGVIVTFFVVL